MVPGAPVSSSDTKVVIQRSVVLKPSCALSTTKGSLGLFGSATGRLMVPSGILSPGSKNRLFGNGPPARGSNAAASTPVTTLPSLLSAGPYWAWA